MKILTKIISFAVIGVVLAGLSGCADMGYPYNGGNSYGYPRYGYGYGNQPNYGYGNNGYGYSGHHHHHHHDDDDDDDD